MKMKFLCVFLIFVFCTKVKCKPANELEFQHMRVLDDAELDRVRQRKEVSAIYYYKRELPRLQGFLKELDKTAEYLKLYGVEVGFFDCGNLHEAKEPKCNEQNAEFHIFTYKSDYVLLELGLETMFDVNSIMSNILQLVLIHDVPILQSVKERIDYENKYKGKKDILFTYQKAIGTFDHRIFMEVAFAYQDKFKFAVCTNKEAIEDLKDHPSNTVDKAIYILRCKDWLHRDIKCPHYKYNKKHDLATLASSVKALTYPLVFMMPSEGMDVPYYQDNAMPVVYFWYDKTCAKDTLSAAKDTANTFYTIIGVVAVNVDDLKPEDLEQLGYDGPFPAVAYHTRMMDSPQFLEMKNWNLQTVHNHILEKLNENPVDSVTEEPVDHKIQVEYDHRPEGGDPDDEYVDDGDQFMENHGVDEAEIEEVETQDDKVAEAVYQSRRKPPQVDSIDALTDKTFPTTVKNKDLVFVLFYLPFDDKSVAFLYAYADASKEVTGDPARPLASVNCFDWTDVCGNEKIISYPTVKMYRNGKMLKEYKGLLDSKAVVTTLKLLNQTNPIHLKDSSAISDIMYGVLPNMEPVPTETVVIALFDKPHKKEMKMFESVSIQLEDQMTFVYNNDGAADKIPNFQFKSPSIVVMRSDMLSPHKVYNGKMDVDSIKDFILKARIPSMPELTVEWFPTLFKQEKPFVILFKDNYQESARVKKELEDVVLSEKFPGLQFVWMKAEPTTLGRTILNEYDKDNRLPAISYVDLKDGTVFNNKHEYPTKDTITEWLSGVINLKIGPSKQLKDGDWKPTKKGYDFLALVDKERERKKKAKKHNNDEELISEEEQGIGFDRDGNEVDLKRKPKLDQDIQDNEIREELLALHKTRLYRSKHKDHMSESSSKGHGHLGEQSADRYHGSQGEQPSGKTLKHEEL